jgi:serine/threonine protein kinase
MADSLIGQVLLDKYHLIKLIGKGSFGRAYLAEDILTKQKVALKVEKISKKEKDNLLKHESIIMKFLSCEHIPEVFIFGNTQLYNILPMQLLGLSLEKALSISGGKMQLKSACYIGIEMINALEFIHNKGFIHRDLKPDNFMFGAEAKSKKLYIIDFGLAKKFLSKGKHIELTSGKSLIGTARYASINSHEGLEQSRRDDLESIGYIIIYLLKGVLPWQGLKLDKGEDHFKAIKEKKKKIIASELTSNLPNEFKEYIEYVKKLEFKSEPDYSYLKNLFLKILFNKYNTKEILLDYEWLDKHNDIESHNTKKNITSNLTSMQINKSPLYSGNEVNDVNEKNDEIQLDYNSIG